MDRGSDYLTFLGGVSDMRELLPAVARFCNSNGIAAIESACDAGLRDYLRGPDSNVTNDMFLVARLCCPLDIAQARYHHTGEVTDVGRLAIQRIGEAVLRTRSPDQGQLTAALACSTVRSVLAARQLCITALQASISTSNCFRVFQFADQCGIAPLRQPAEACCLSSLTNAAATTAASCSAASSSNSGDAPSQVSSSDVAGFVQLTQGQLQSLLASDGLQVTSEFEVFDSIWAWAQARPQERTALLPELVRSCVRLGAMTLPQLERLDQDPRVVASPDITRVVAHASISCMLGKAFGGPEGARPRPSVLRAAAAAAAGGYGPGPVPQQQPQQGAAMVWAP